MQNAKHGTISTKEAAVRFTSIRHIAHIRRAPPTDSPEEAKKDVPAPAVHGPKTLQNSLGSSRFGRSKSAAIVHGKHAGTVALPHRCRAASADTAAMLFWVWLASGPIKMRKDSAGGRAKTGNRAKSQNAAKQTPAFIEGVRIIRA
jgi:hypothetical protein